MVDAERHVKYVLADSGGAGDRLEHAVDAHRKHLELGIASECEPVLARHELEIAAPVLMKLSRPVLPEQSSERGQVG